jgi:hypothetical protein
MSEFAKQGSFPMRHEVKAIPASPVVFDRGAAQASALAERRAARDVQALVDKERLIRHQDIATGRLVLPAKESERLIDRAREEVARWRRERLCTPDYSDRWEALLQLPLPQLARAMADPQLEWGPALRQNSPWLVAPHPGQ